MGQEQFNAAVNDLALSIGQLVRRVRAAAPAQDLSLTEAAVMGRLAKDGPATISDLARGERIKPQSMGAVIAALEQRGLVGRTPHPTDGRQARIALTDKGAALRERTRAVKLSWLAEAIAQLDAPEQETLFAASEIMTRLVEL